MGRKKGEEGEMIFEEIQIITSKDLSYILKQNPFDICLIDTRELKEFELNHIITSINLRNIKNQEKLEYNFTNFDDKLFFRQREFCKVVIYDNSITEETIFLYNLLKKEGISKEIYILYKGFKEFSENFGTFCLKTKSEEKLLIYQPIEERRKFSHSRLFRSFSIKIECEEPTQILDHLYLGNAQNSLSKTQLEKLQIKYILNIAKECKNQFLNEFVYKKYPFIDEEFENIQDSFQDTFEFIETARKSESRMLVHCFMGMSRSSSIVIAYLMKLNQWNFNKSFEFVKKKRPIIDLNPGFKKQLIEYEKHLNL